jgi:hypothetical protein
VSTLAFSSPGTAPVTSPLARALAGVEGIADLSLLGKLEVRGVDVHGLVCDATVVPITSTRALVICANRERGRVLRALPGSVVDLTAAFAGIAVEGKDVMRRLTDLDLGALPAAGKVAGVPAIVNREGTTFQIFFAQEYGDSVVELVRDVHEGLA